MDLKFKKISHEEAKKLTTDDIGESSGEFELVNMVLDNDDEEIYLATSDGSPIAMVAALRTTVEVDRDELDVLYVDAVDVLDEYRGMGVGRKFMEYLEGLASTDGLDAVVLDALEGKKGFYAKLGYEPTDIFLHGSKTTKMVKFAEDLTRYDLPQRIV